MWVPPEREWIKCNFDWCSKGNLCMAGAGGLLINHLGDCIASYGVNLGVFLNNKEEVMVF